MNKLIKNYSYNLLYQILVMILPIVTTPYISRVLKANGVGSFNYSYAIVSVAVIIAQLGTNMYGQREIAYVQNDIYQRSEKFWNIVVLRILMSFVVIPVYFLISLYLSDYTAILIAMTVFLIANIFDVSWFFQGLEDFKKTALRSIVVKIIGVLLIFLFVKNENDIVLYSVILGGSQLIGNIILIMYVPRYIVGIKDIKLRLRYHVKPIFELFLPTAAVYVYTYVDKIFLGLMSTDAQVGYYSQPEKIIKLLMTIITALGAVLLPHIAAAIKSEDQKQIKTELLTAISFVFCVGLPMVVGSALIANRFIPWFLGDGYDKSILLFQMLSPLIIVIGLASVVGQAVLIPLKKQKVYTCSIIIGAIVNVLINIILIPRCAAVGAAIGTLTAEFTVTSIQFIEAKKSIGFSIKNIVLSIKNYIMASVILLVIGFMLNIILPFGTVYMFAIVLVCIITYGIILLFAKDKLVLNVIGKAKRRKI